MSAENQASGIRRKSFVIPSNDDESKSEAATPADDSLVRGKSDRTGLSWTEVISKRRVQLKFASPERSGSVNYAVRESKSGIDWGGASEEVLKKEYSKIVADLGKTTSYIDRLLKLEKNGGTGTRNI